MKALVKYARGKGNLEVRDVPDPQPGPGQVQIQVAAAGVCGSDLHIWHDEIQIPILPPVIIGHEFAGCIAAVGEGVEQLRPGDRVTAETTATACGRCLPCRTGHTNMCSTRTVVGYSVDGCFARYCVVNERQVHLLPEGVDFLAGALTEPLACCVHAVLELTTISAGDVVAVSGPGPIGLLCVQLAAAAGGRVIACGTSQDRERLDRSLEMGASSTLEVSGGDSVAQLLAWSGGPGVDVFLECSGAPAAARMGLAVTRRGGQYTQVGLFSGPFEIAFDQIAYKELRVTGSLGQRWTSWQRALALLSQGKADTRPLVTNVLPLTEWQEAFRMFEEKRGLKIVLEPV